MYSNETPQRTASWLRPTPLSIYTPYDDIVMTTSRPQAQVPMTLRKSFPRVVSHRVSNRISIHDTHSWDCACLKTIPQPTDQKRTFFKISFWERADLINFETEGAQHASARASTTRISRERCREKRKQDSQPITPIHSGDSDMRSPVIHQRRSLEGKLVGFERNSEATT